MKYLSIITLLLLLNVNFSNAQNEGDPCDYGDTLKVVQLQQHNYNENGWYGNMDKLYLFYDRIEDVHLDGDSILYEIPELEIVVTADYIQGDVFNGVSIWGGNTGKWTQMVLEYTNSDLEDIHIRRPDSINFPTLVEIRYSEGFGSGMGSYQEEVYEYWDISEYRRIAKIDSYYYEFGRNELITGEGVGTRMYTMRREIRFENGELHIDTATIRINNTSMRYDENKKEVMKQSNDRSLCDPVIYRFKNGFLLKKG